MGGLTNWAGNISFESALERPQSVSELQQLVADSEKVRVLGTGHSFNRIADSTGTLVSVADLPKVIELGDRGVTVSAGLRYGEITAALESKGLALHNLGSLPHISVAGACSTGTHGSGDTNGPLADAVNAITFVNASGELVTLTRGDADFPGSVISLGALGVIVSLTLDVQPSYELSQIVYDGLPVDRLGSDFTDVMGSAYSVSAFTDWVDAGVMVWRKQRAGAPIDALLLARDNDVVLVPEGYHPVVSPPGYTTYYLNVLAGSAQSLANQDDPDYGWVKGTYRRMDERLPLY